MRVLYWGTRRNLGLCEEYILFCLFRYLNIRIVVGNLFYTTLALKLFFYSTLALFLSLEKADLSCFEPRSNEGNRENMLKLPQEELPFKLPQKPSASSGVGAGRSLPAHIFQPAVLLSPPRQKSNQESSPLQNGEISGQSRLLLFQSLGLRFPLEMSFLSKFLHLNA